MHSSTSCLCCICVHHRPLVWAVINPPLSPPSCCCRHRRCLVVMPSAGECTGPVKLAILLTAFISTHDCLTGHSIIPSILPCCPASPCCRCFSSTADLVNCCHLLRGHVDRLLMLLPCCSSCLAQSTRLTCRQTGSRLLEVLCCRIQPSCCCCCRQLGCMGWVGPRSLGLGQLEA